jgi:hypothetical protein
MHNDKLFTAYALVLIAGVASVLTASVVAGVAALPTPLGFVEHLAMSLLFRAAYKSIGGFDWPIWAGPTAEIFGEHALPSLHATADALS